MIPGAPWEVLVWTLVAVAFVGVFAVLFWAIWAHQERNRYWREFRRNQVQLELNRERIRKRARERRERDWIARQNGDRK